MARNNPFAVKFPRLDGGRPKGVNSSGIATFKGDIAESLAREWAQNAIDAHYNGWPIELDFRLENLPRQELPGIDGVELAIRSCKEYWTKHEQEQHFCDQALAKFENQIPVLIVSDRGTTGLRGADKDTSGQWFGLVECTETSIGDDNRLGSYGIGKNAVFAASIFQTVYFSTRSVNEEYGFKGVSILMTHRNQEGAATQPDGAIGMKCPESNRILALRDRNQIPAIFRRAEHGTSTFIPAYKPYYKNPVGWQDELIISLMENFWPAIHFEKVTFRVQDTVIDNNTLPRLLNRYAEKQNDFQADKYYRVFDSVNRRTFEGELRYLGKVALFATKEPEIPDMPNDVAITRTNGMIITTDNFRGLGFPFAGLVVCDNDVANRMLRDMEPPQHNALHPKQLEEVDGEKVLKELHDWIRKKLLEFKPSTDSEEFELPDMAKFFPASDDEEIPFESNGNYPRENLNQSPESREIEVKPFSISQAAGAEGQEDTAGGTGEGEGLNPDPGPPGDEKTSGGAVDTSVGQKGVIQPVQARATFQKPGQYRLFLRSDSTFRGNLSLFASGDSVREKLRILNAEDTDGNVLTPQDGTIRRLHFTTNRPLIILVNLGEQERYALEIEVRDET